MTFEARSCERVPQHLREGCRKYVEEGNRTGDFLWACLNNNLSMAVFKADPESLAGLKEICFWMHWDIPSECHGSEEHVAHWIERGGVEGIEADA